MINACVIIPAAGIGKRMKSHGPKANIKIDNKNTVINRAVSILNKSFGKIQINVILGFQKEKIDMSNNNLNFIVNEDFETTNVSKSINIGIKSSKRKDCLIIYGDLVFKKDIFKNFNFENSCIWVEKSDKRNSEIGVNIIDGAVEHFSYGIFPKWAQIVFLKEKDKKIFLEISNNEKTNKWFGYEILNKMIDKGIIFSVNYIDEIVEIDTYLDIIKAKKFVRKNENIM
jgi:choline kinase